MNWHDLVRFGTNWYDSARFGTICLGCEEGLWAGLLGGGEKPEGKGGGLLAAGWK